MKAAILHEWGKPLSIEEVPPPQLGTGEVIVDVAASGLLPYFAEVFGGGRNYPLELPAIPGAGGVGRIRSVGPDATHLKPGDWVYVDAAVRSRDSILAPEMTLQGLSARGSGGLKLAKYYHDGTMAEQVRVPTENAVPLGDIAESEIAQWCALGVALVPYGGLLAAGVTPGETVLISGGTGTFGTAAVAVALAMGVAKVVVAGRNGAVLEDLVDRFGPRVRPAALSGLEERDVDVLKSAASGRIDCVLDILPPSVSASVARAAIMSVRPYGRAVLMGGVGMLGGDDLKLPYPWIMRNCVTLHGQWMYPQSAVPCLIELARCGLLDLSLWEMTSFDIGDANAAISHAATEGGPFKMTTVTF